MLLTWDLLVGQLSYIFEGIKVYSGAAGVHLGQKLVWTENWNTYDGDVNLILRGDVNIHVFKELNFERIHKFRELYGQGDPWISHLLWTLWMKCVYQGLM